MSRASAESDRAVNALACSRPSVTQHWCQVQLAWTPKAGQTPSCPGNLRAVGLMTPDTEAFLLILKQHANPVVQETLQQHPQFAHRQVHSTVDPI